MLNPYALEEVHYPEADGQPMAESDVQREYLIYAVESLRLYFGDRTDVYVSGNLFLYYEQGNPKAVVAPDCFVVFGVDGHDRRIYKLWEEGKAPDFVLEVTSKSTVAEDQGTKRGLYAFLGVKEYWQYDPTQDYLDPPLQGFELVGANYRPIPRAHPFGPDYVLSSRVLGLDLLLQDRRLRFRESARGAVLLSHFETETARREAEARAAFEQSQRRAAEAKVAELEARLRALQGPEKQ
jgi:Uma2 family endonuclease